ncbi:hypothetical protein L873DRAFT_1818448 [Choiromyces venosus 120613-1]|uniref:Uncharacterized protein n=1 Tax=Choiromyces venosus 120613-1 TaxID=1336337 RepID=A0A3N4J6B5_9PEZI|nr:hypothetical protein L873DRAFT_1818448 [Choiromyces venosus 120613-1]
MPLTHSGTGSAPRVPLLKRAVILALNWHGLENMPFAEIERRLGVKKRTAMDIVYRAQVNII